MIDYVETIIRCEHEPFGTVASYIDYITGVVKDRHLNIYLKNGIGQIQVRSIKNGQAILISGNPLTFLQQHNVFGSDDLIGLVIGVFEIVVEQLGIHVTKSTWLRIEQGDFVLRRVDVAINYCMPQQSVVNKVIQEIGWNWFSQNKNVSVYPNQTVYLNQHSENMTLKFYNKYQQMIASRKNLPHKQKLLDYAKTIVRGELTLRTPELKIRELDRGSDWGDKILPRQLMVHAHKEAGLCGEIEIRATDESESLSAALKRVYSLWAHGESIQELYGKATFYRAAAQLKQFDTDIRSLPHKQRTVKVNIADHLAAPNILNFPKFAITHDLIFIPRSR